MSGRAARAELGVMRRAVASRPSRYRTSPRGAMFLWFSLVALPLVFFSAAMAVDFTRIVIAGRQASNAAAAAAVAGAWEFQPDSTTLASTAAHDAAIGTYCVSNREGALSLARPPRNAPRSSCPGGTLGAGTEGRSVPITVAVSSSGRAAGVDTVTVTAKYQIDDLMFFRLFGVDRPFVGPDVVRSATVCVPSDAAGPTGGYCARPID